MGSAGTELDHKIYVAGQILDYVRDRLVIFMPYFNRALLYMPVRFDLPKSADDQNGGAVLSTDGREIFADAEGVINLFRTDPERLPRIYLHMIFHCVFLHPFSLSGKDRRLYQLAADCACEMAVLDLDINDFVLPDDARKRDFLGRVREAAGDISADRIFRYLDAHPLSAAEFGKEADTVFMDGHRFWPSGDAGGVKEIFISRSASEEFEEQVKQWKKIQQTVGTENLSYRKGMGEKAGKKRIRVSRVTRDDYDYSEFLRRFAADVEEVRLNPEEFDYIYYTYGLALYENMPLIEPLEYRSSKKIQDLVIAIDTSGSCQGAVVRSFLDKTYSLLKNSDVFTERMNLFIIQCDCEIQSEVRITSDEEFERYMKNIEIAGAGGTDFTPVFARVDELIRAGEFHDFRGLLYFTDGLGKFPEQKPSYKTAFISVGRVADKPKLPSWVRAYRLT